MTMTERADTGFAEVNGARLSYEVSGEGRPLVLIHAGIADSRMWDAQFTTFAQQYRVIRYDMRGFGRSAMPPGPFAHHEDLHGLLSFLGIESAYLVGVSLGGRVAIDLALTHPELVAALIPAASALDGHRWSDEARRRWAEIGAAVEGGDVARAVELELRMWVNGPTRTPEQVDAAVRERVRTMNAAIFARAADDSGEQGLEPPAIDRLGEIRAPTLAIAGDRDMPDILAIADRLAAGIAGARKVVMPGVAHLLTMEQPVAFNRIVLDFLRDLYNSGAGGERDFGAPRRNPALDKQ